MAEAFPDTQASGSLEISTETLERTLAQVATLPVDEEVPDTVQPPQGNSVLTEQSVSNGNVPVCDILKTLNGIALRFDSFEQQARADRDRVSKLYEQLNVENTTSKKNKTPKKTVVSKNVRVNETDCSSHRFTGARPKTTKQMQSTEMNC